LFHNGQERLVTDPIKKSLYKSGTRAGAYKKAAAEGGIADDTDSIIG
jgi:hypothetical protein